MLVLLPVIKVVFFLFFCVSACVTANSNGIILLKTQQHVGFGHLSETKLEHTLAHYKVTTLQRTTVSRAPKKTALQPHPNTETILVLSLPTENYQHTLNQLRQMPDVQWAEPLLPVSLFSLPDTPPNDPNYAKQTVITDTMMRLLLHMPIRRSVRVAVIDSGIDYFHEDLFGNIWQNLYETENDKDDDNNGLVDDIYGYNFYGAYIGKGQENPKDDVGHGTHLAGIIGAGINNETGITGLHPSVALMNIRFTSETGIGNQFDAALAIRYAIQQQADIILCGWGYFRLNSVLKEAIEDALDSGIIVVAAMGNNGTDKPEFPAALPGVIAVGSVNEDGTWASFSNVGDHVQLVGFGTGILSTSPGNNYTKQSGTSQSAAFVTGTIARMFSANPRLTREQLTTHLILAAEPIVYPQKNPYTGYGILNPETLFKTLNVTPEPEMPSSSWKAPHITPPKQTHEDWWTGLFLFPWRFFAGIWQWLI